jgi:hypothetical protein
MTDEGSRERRPAGWKKDPSGRHFGRYWDGQQWTEHVISAEKVQSIDPVPLRPEPSLLSDAPPPPPAPSAPAAAAPTEVISAAPTIRGPMPTAPGWTPDAAPSRGPLPVAPIDPSDPRGKGENQVLTAVRGWPRWATWTAGSVVALVLIAAAASGDEDDDKPVSVVGQVETTLTMPVVTTLAPTTTQLATTIPPTTLAPTTVTTPATTRATVAATAPPTTPTPTAAPTTAAPVVRQGVTPGAFCSPGGARGVTDTGIAMTCTTSATDERNRWRAS